MKQHETIKTSVINQQAKLTVEDLSLLNGVSEKINTEYLKTLQQIILFSAAEMIRNGAEEVSVELPYIGSVGVKRKLKNRIKKSDDIAYTFTYNFKPGNSFSKELKKVFEDGVCPLPTMLADKYGKKLLSMYERFLNE